MYWVVCGFFAHSPVVQILFFRFYNKGADFDIFSETLFPSFSVSGRCRSTATAFVTCSSAEPCPPARSLPEREPVPPPCSACSPTLPWKSVCCLSLTLAITWEGGICPHYFCCFHSWWHFSGFQTPFLPAFPNELKHSGSLFSPWFGEWTHSIILQLHLISLSLWPRSRPSQKDWPGGRAPVAAGVGRSPAPSLGPAPAVLTLSGCRGHRAPSRLRLQVRGFRGGPWGFGAVPAETQSRRR